LYAARLSSDAFLLALTRALSEAGFGDVTFTRAEYRVEDIPEPGTGPNRSRALPLLLLLLMIPGALIACLVSLLYCAFKKNGAAAGDPKGKEAA
jgi:hypothetical protein